ncbi:MFS transporter [Capsulimonas corticalis]|uniref:MFS transporter n=1 Tax=Capsulimonas corticalis TaxID=2219043 RepID=A0A402CZ25_9BACT|nr:MFS transporter [Capsulimonas corticalis]BDI29568.1 MFS transporter [Capsulimonas corticalis]
MNFALLALAIAAFGIGTTEFVIMGLLPDVAHDLCVSIPTAGLLVAGYALGVAIGAPIMAMLTSRLPRKRALLILMGIFVLGNFLCAVSGNYALLMGARIITALCHGAFFGIGSVTAADLAPEGKKASAVAMMFAGLTLANVLGVPMGTALGQAEGWRATFWAVSGIGVVAFLALLFLLPANLHAEPANLARELRAIRSVRVWTALAMTVLFSASMFALFTYIAPILQGITHVSPHGVSLTLLLIGVGMTVGNFVGGKLADRRLSATLLGATAVIGVLLMVFYWVSASVIPTELTLFVWGAVCFASASALQLNAMTVGSAAPSLIATMNIGAFNLGNALGAWIGGLAVASTLGLHGVPLSGVAISIVGLVVTGAFVWTAKPKPAVAEAIPASEYETIISA